MSKRHHAAGVFWRRADTISIVGDAEWRAQILARPGGDYLLRAARLFLPDYSRYQMSIVWRFLEAGIHPVVAANAIWRGITSPLNEAAAIRKISRELGVR